MEVTERNDVNPLAERDRAETVAGIRRGLAAARNGKGRSLKDVLDRLRDSYETPKRGKDKRSR